jgi:hypothetical protein
VTIADDADVYVAERVTVADLLGALKSTPKLGSLKQKLKHLAKTETVAAPLSQPVSERETRKAAYEDTAQFISRWQPLVTRNRRVGSPRLSSHSVGRDSNESVRVRLAGGAVGVSVECGAVAAADDVRAGA